MQRQHLLKVTYVLNFFIALHVFLTLYINSSALAELFSESIVGILFTVGSALGIAALIVIPRLLRNTGNVRATIGTLVLEMGALAVLAWNPHPIAFLAAFLVHITLIRALQLDVDILLETATDKRAEGTQRGFFLTISNTALVLSPLIVGFLLAETTAYGRVYIASFVALLPALFLVLFSYKHFRDPAYTHTRMARMFAKVFRFAYLRRIFAANFLLRLFYAVMVIYTPLYLHNEIGLPWDILGVIFTVMLLPFAILEYPLGKLADTKYGEKEMLALGFFITALATALLSFATTHNFIVWALLLLSTRIGASMVEIMTETYFFKKADVSDADIISAYRMIEPLAYIIGPAAVSLALLVIDTRFIFLLLGILLLQGIHVSFKLRDTL